MTLSSLILFPIFGAQFIMAKKTAIGIDLGTTYSSLARLSGSLRVLPTSAAVCRGVSGQLDLCVSLFESF